MVLEIGRPSAADSSASFCSSDGSRLNITLFRLVGMVLVEVLLPVLHQLISVATLRSPPIDVAPVAPVALPTASTGLTAWLAPKLGRGQRPKANRQVTTFRTEGKGQGHAEGMTNLSHHSLLPKSVTRKYGFSRAT